MSARQLHRHCPPAAPLHGPVHNRRTGLRIALIAILATISSWVAPARGQNSPPPGPAPVRPADPVAPTPMPVPPFGPGSMPVRPAAPTPAMPPAPAGVAVSVRMEVALSVIGDCNFRMTCRWPEQFYRLAKELSRPAPDKNDPHNPRHPSATALLRQLGLDGLWADFENPSADFDDAASTVQIRCTFRGVARIDRGRRWGMLLGEELKGARIREEAGVVTLDHVVKGPLGPSHITAVVRLPAGAAEPRVEGTPLRLTWAHDLPEQTAGRAELSFRLQARPHLMGCMAKLYGYEKFPQLWTARAVARNTGAQTLRDYRVRFRLVGWTAGWSEWKRCAVVHPGQTVLDAFFPVLDIDKVTAADGRRQVMLEVEYEYADAAGRKVSETDATKVELLSRNERTPSSLPLAECRSFFEARNLHQFTFPSYVTGQDPVIQQVAGMVVGQVKGGFASTDDDGAVRFMAELHAFMRHNKIAYQSPPGFQEGTLFIQHVKFPRDVLANKAGTCVDLAIFYAAVCEAVGLDAVMVTIPGHAFPAVRLPKSGKLLCVETTVLNEGFDVALKFGKENADKIAAGKEPSLLVSIPEARSRGIVQLDLPKLSEDILKKWGYSPATGGADIGGMGGAAAGIGGDTAARMVGVWTGTANAGGFLMGCDIAIDDQGNIVSRLTTAQGQAFITRGKWTFANGVVTVRTTEGIVEKGTITFADEDTMVYRVTASSNPGVVGTVVEVKRAKMNR